MKFKFEKLLITLIFVIAYLSVLYHPHLPVFSDTFNSIDGSIYVVRFFDVIVSICIFFIIGFYLIPNYLIPKKMIRFVILSLLIVSIISIAEYGFDYLVKIVFNLPVESNEFSDKMLDHPYRKSFELMVIPGNILVYIIGFLYGLSRDWFDKSKKQKELIHEKMKADLDFLRSQIDPHFFFNALNNIYAISQRNNDDETGNAIVQLSGIMRYMIYESNVPTISLVKEIEHIENYIEVTKLKFSKDDPVTFRVSKEGDFENIQIAPLLLIPFVENSVKHGLSSKGQGYIYIDIKVQTKKLIFRIENSKIEEERSIKKNSGVGLENVQKRLELLYPKKHILQITDSKDNYLVDLTVNFAE